MRIKPNFQDPVNIALKRFEAFASIEDTQTTSGRLRQRGATALHIEPTTQQDFVLHFTPQCADNLRLPPLSSPPATSLDSAYRTLTTRAVNQGQKTPAINNLIRELQNFVMLENDFNNRRDMHFGALAQQDSRS